MRRFPKSDKAADAKQSLKEIAANRGNGMNPELAAKPDRLLVRNIPDDISALPALQGSSR